MATQWWLLILFGAVLLFALWTWGEPHRQARRRAWLRRQPFPAAWRQVLNARVPYVRRLPADLQLQLKGHIQVFLAEKAFIGCRGQVITDEVRVTIAAQACLLLLDQHQAPPRYFPNLRQVLVYPGAFRVKRVHTDEAGVVWDEREVLSGESWQEGQVVLSWKDVLAGAAVPDDGRNVVIHEFAHQLDQENGPANGAPLLRHPDDPPRWSQVMNQEFERLQQRVHEAVDGEEEDELLDPYGATAPAEFFAVASEVFFEQPARLSQEHPALYAELANLYGVNPLSWS